MVWVVVACVVIAVLALLSLSAMKLSGDISGKEDEKEWEMTFGNTKSSNSDLDSSES